MPSFSTYAVAAMALLSSVQAGFYTTYPVGADTVNPGQTIQITWKSDDQEPILTNVPSYTLKFMTGGNFVQTTVSTIGTFPITQTTIPFTIPQTAPGMYFLMYTASDGSGSSWSTRFSISGGTTWYPEGVATGMDPGTSSTDSGSSQNTATSTGAGSSSTRTSAEPTTESSSSHEQSTKDTSSAESSDEPSTDASSNTDGATDTSTDESTPTTEVTSATDDTEDTTTEASGDDELNTDASEEEQNTDDTTTKKSRSEEGSSTDDEPSSEEDVESSSSGAAYRYLSAAAILVASAFMI